MVEIIHDHAKAYEIGKSWFKLIW